MAPTDEKLDKILDVLLNLVELARKQERRLEAIEENQNKVLSVLMDHSDRLDHLEGRQPAAH